MSKNTNFQQEIQKIFAANDWRYKKDKFNYFAKVDAIDKSTIKNYEFIIKKYDNQNYLVHIERNRHLKKDIKNKYKYLQSKTNEDKAYKQIINSFYELIKDGNEYVINKKNLYNFYKYYQTFINYVNDIERVNDKNDYTLKMPRYQPFKPKKTPKEMLDSLQKQKNIALTEF